MTTPLDQTRAEFEAWAREHISKNPGDWPLLDGHDGEDHWAFLAWQAAIASRAAGWISVEERLPEHHQDVIALYWPYNNKQNRQCTTGAVFDVNEGKFLDDADGDDLHWPSHWMPRPALPAPPTPQDPIAAKAAKET